MFAYFLWKHLSPRGLVHSPEVIFCRKLYTLKMFFLLKCDLSSIHIIVSKKVNYLLRKYDFAFDNKSVSKKANYLLQKYDLFAQKYNLLRNDDLVNQIYIFFAEKLVPESRIRRWGDQYPDGPGAVRPRNPGTLGPIYV